MVNNRTFDRSAPLLFFSWLCYRYGFGTYLHMIKGYYSQASREESQGLLENLVAKSSRVKGNMFVDTIISPSYTSAIAQVLQLPSSSGMENNMIIFEYDKSNPEDLKQIIDNLAMAEAGNFDICILGSSRRNVFSGNGINVWVRNLDRENTNLMILLSYII